MVKQLLIILWDLIVKEVKMKALWITLAIIFIIITLGIIDVEMSFTDGTRLTYKSWLHLIIGG